MKTTGNTVFISGGSAGIGLSIAKKLSKSGNKVIINGRNEERLEKALLELDAAVAIKGDLSVQTDRERIAKELADEYPNMNIVINNAGAAFPNDLGDPNNNPVQQAYEEINTNYLSVIHFTSLILPQLLEKEDAAIVNISSVAAYRVNRSLPTYSASKAALHSYTRALRDTFMDNDKLNVYEVYPPLVNTELTAEIGGAKGIAPEEVAEELFLALGKNQFEVPVGDAKNIHQLVEPIERKIRG